MLTVFRGRIRVSLLLLLLASASRAELRIEGETWSEGLITQTVQFALEGESRKRSITVVRIDPAIYRPVLLTSERHGGSRSAWNWMRDFELIAVINASMYRPDGRSTGLMVDGQNVNNGWDNPRYGGFLAFDPVQEDLPLVAAFGRDCADFDLQRIRRDYRVVIQSYRMLDCEGRAIRWKDKQAYPSSAIGLDHQGWLVFLHSPSPLRMRDLNRWVAHPDLRLRWAMFVEGGSEALLAVRLGERKLGAAGESRHPLEMGARFWPVPNVVGLRRR